jgi:hypothetical protein
VAPIDATSLVLVNQRSGGFLAARRKLEQQEFAKWSWLSMLGLTDFSKAHVVAKDGSALTGRNAMLSIWWG